MRASGDLKPKLILVTRRILVALVVREFEVDRSAGEPVLNNGRGRPNQKRAGTMSARMPICRAT